MTSDASTVEQYIAELPEDRRAAIEAVRAEILRNLPPGYEEQMLYGMISYVVPHSILPEGYHCNPKDPLTYAALANQKNHMAVYLMCQYGNEAEMKWVSEAYAATGKKLDMGKSCVRFKKLENLALDVIGQAIARVPVERYVSQYRAILSSRQRQGTGSAR
ncbi:MAG TPA: DUF1801 domain-containing protein [Fimbriimonadaceae bacterium]|nr:DUF1801 domain-containing protein [Fimbriimonadaceae bacterium]HRJ32853.1 DUF1801 domain-containing protein [Fimbriimonadaceae bacterium]